MRYPGVVILESIKAFSQEQKNGGASSRPGEGLLPHGAKT